MAKITQPSNVGFKTQLPCPATLPYKEYFDAQDDYFKGLQEHCKTRKPDEQYAGRVLRFPVADGYAVYVVASIVPLVLVHVPTGDGWEFRYVNRLTVKDIKEKLDTSVLQGLTDR